MAGLVAQAAGQGAGVVVLPESIDLERCGLDASVSGAGVPELLAPGFDQSLTVARQLADHYSLMLVAGTHIRWHGEAFVNTAILAWPGGHALGDKNVLTQWESQEWGLKPGKGLVRHGLVGVATCYEIEFPGSARALAEAGCGLIAVPAFTEFQRGFDRVRWCCHARTVENQAFVAHASLVGGLGREPVVSTYGTSAVLCPSLAGFPGGGVLAETHPGEEGIAVADVDFGLLAASREGDDVRNWADRDKGDWVVCQNALSGPG